MFLSCRDVPRPMGRIERATVPAVELATITHAGSHQGIDRAYGQLAAYVARHALVVDGTAEQSPRVPPARLVWGLQPSVRSAVIR